MTAVPPVSPGRMRRCAARLGPATGISALEFLILASVIAVLSAFTPYLLGSLNRSAELERAVGTVEESIVRARQTARMYHTAVTLHLDVEGKEGVRSIRLQIPALQHSEEMLKVEQVFLIPEGFTVVSGQHQVHFDAYGYVETAVPAEVVSTRSDTLRRNVLIF